MPLDPAWKRENRTARILIVDDDAEIVDTLSYALGNEGYEVLVARDGNQGLAMAEKSAPDLLILDMMMPKRSGFLVLEGLHRTQTKNFRIIMVTGNEGERHKAYAEMLGIDDYIRKPFALDRLLESVKHWLNEPFPTPNAQEP
ncbi:MAG: response regulator transcription factor [Pirellulales bacterium]